MFCSVYFYCRSSPEYGIHSVVFSRSPVWVLQRMIKVDDRRFPELSASSLATISFQPTVVADSARAAFIRMFIYILMLSNSTIIPLLNMQ